MEEAYNYKDVGKIFSFLISVLLTNCRLLTSFLLTLVLSVLRFISFYYPFDIFLLPF